MSCPTQIMFQGGRQVRISSEGHAAWRAYISRSHVTPSASSVQEAKFFFFPNCPCFLVPRMKMSQASVSSHLPNICFVSFSNKP